MIARFLGAVGQVIWIDPDAVPTNKARLKRQEIPFRPCGRESTSPVSISSAWKISDNSFMKAMLHSRWVFSITFAASGDPDRRRPMNTGFHHCPVDAGYDPQRLRVLCRNHFHDRFEAVLLFVAGIDALRRITDVEIRANLELRTLLQDRRAIPLRPPRDKPSIHRRRYRLSSERLYPFQGAMRRTSRRRSGLPRPSSIGVGTATMKKSAGTQSIRASRRKLPATDA